MKTLPLTVLFHEGPMARAYLGMLAAEGLRVERIVRMVGRRDPARRRPIAPWLPSGFRRGLAALVQDRQMNHWPRELRRRHRDLCEGWWRELAAAWSYPPGIFEHLVGPSGDVDRADSVDELFIDGLGDPVLEQHLRRLPGRNAVLFTGGGMVPASLLSIPSCRFIHVHPGHLPHVRGADGLLWSILLRGRPGATAFYMDAGLDTGDVILARDLEVLPVPRAFAELDVLTGYRMLYAYVDPLLRAVLLREIVRRHPTGLADLPTKAQAAGEGTTFHFMNERLRRVAFQRLVDLSHERADPVV
ncbi:formyltransferase family protein [Piscinibacter sp. HJYY11]|uniref:formyltransferase family protein n=1 Tax=Piscinibacter sp. HJYY11 TaxID=2801333 RepID=UPI00191E581E|nr:formyltransferase family protein [Piscinibacter sp. HJYY11]MBL0727932.1 hypothetical protein [Piscinibacter sp. HJYY11]